jgi:hypothetical protein
LLNKHLKIIHHFHPQTDASPPGYFYNKLYLAFRGGGAVFRAGR